MMLELISFVTRGSAQSDKKAANFLGRALSTRQTNKRLHARQGKESRWALPLALSE